MQQKLSPHERLFNLSKTKNTSLKFFEKEPESKNFFEEKQNSDSQFNFHPVIQEKSKNI